MSDTSDSDGDTSVEKEQYRERYQCDYCESSYSTKGAIQKHITKCSINLNRKHRCLWCGLTFFNRGVLAMHASRIHNDYSYKSVREGVSCSVCSAEFHDKASLKFHIRRAHFNLKATVPFAEIKKVNQVWFEKAMNNKIVEIKKTGPSKLIIKSLSDKTHIRLNDVKQEVIDLSDIYPVNRGRVECKVCLKIVSKKDYKKHLKEKHLDHRIHECNNCKRQFKRTYLFLKHVCHASRKLSGVRNQFKETHIAIAHVGSLPEP